MKQIFSIFIAISTILTIGEIEASAENSEMTTWDFGIYTINLPADVEEQETNNEESSAVFYNADKTFCFFPGFESIEEDFDCAEFLHSAAMEIFNMDTDELGIMLVTTGKESPMLCTVGYTEDTTFYVGAYPDYDLGKVCLLAFVVANDFDVSPIYIGMTFRVKDSTTDD